MWSQVSQKENMNSSEPFQRLEKTSEKNSYEHSSSSCSERTYWNDSPVSAWDMVTSIGTLMMHLLGLQLPERFKGHPLLPFAAGWKEQCEVTGFSRAVISLEWPLLFQNLSLEDLGGISFVVSMKGTRNASYLIFTVGYRHADSP